MIDGQCGGGRQLSSACLAKSRAAVCPKHKRTTHHSMVRVRQAAFRLLLFLPHPDIDWDAGEQQDEAPHHRRGARADDGLDFWIASAILLSLERKGYIAIRTLSRRAEATIELVTLGSRPERGAGERGPDENKMYPTGPPLTAGFAKNTLPSVLGGSDLNKYSPALQRKPGHTKKELLGILARAVSQTVDRTRGPGACRCDSPCRSQDSWHRL